MERLPIEHCRRRAFGIAAHDFPDRTPRRSSNPARDAVSALHSVGRAEIFALPGFRSPPAKFAAFQMVMFGNVVIKPAKIAYLFDGHGSREKLN